MKVFLLLLVIAAVALVIVRWQVSGYAEFLQDATRITGEVVEAGEQVKDQKNRRKEYVVTYRYTDARGATHINSETLEYHDLRETLTPGAEVEIYVSNKNPARSYLAAPLDRRMNIGEKVTKALPTGEK